MQNNKNKIQTEQKKARINCSPRGERSTPQKTGKRKLNIKYLGGVLLKKMARGGAKELSLNADEVNNLNVFPVPDGDTGDNMRLTMESGVNAIEDIDSDNLALVFNKLSRGMLLGARGNSGVILSQFFAGTASGLQSAKRADAAAVGHALELGVKQAYSSVVSPMEGTILTVAREAVEYAVSRLDEGSTIRSLFSDLVNEMHSSLERTPELLAALKEANVVDSGGAGLLHIMDGFYRVLNGEEPQVNNKDESHAPQNEKEVIKSAPVFDFDNTKDYGYCTELLLQLKGAKCDHDSFDIESVKSFLSDCGDSIVAFRNETVVKIHVHTKIPEKVLEYMHGFGEFISVKIENMTLQHSRLIEDGENKKEKLKKKYGAVTVSSGEGFRELFSTLGVDVIIDGGQTGNPSTSDFLSAFKRISAENIFVFPNNANIIMAANQAADMYKEANVRVVPTKNVGEGYAALSAATFEEEAEEIVFVFSEAIKRVTTGVISPSVRDTEINGVKIHKGDTIGIVNKAVIVSDKDRVKAATSLALHLLSMPGKTVLTAFCGSDAQPEESKRVEESILESCPGREVYFTDGGQCTYPYVFVCE